MASTINSPTLFDRLRHGPPIAALDVRSAAEFAIGHLRMCWQLKQCEALLPILQLSALEDEGVELASKGESAETEVAREQMKSLLRRAIESLPQSEREVYELREIEELSGEETASRLGISLAATKSRLHRARTRVRQYLDEVLVPASRQGSHGNGSIPSQEQSWKSW